MSKKTGESTVERIARMKREKEEAEKNAPKSQSELVSQLTHETDVDTDFEELAQKLEARKAKVSKGANEDLVKMTLYVEPDVARSFNALITKRGEQKQFVNEALKDFVKKKSKELGL